jgi:hypothetical protein
LEKVAAPVQTISVFQCGRNLRQYTKPVKRFSARNTQLGDAVIEANNETEKKAREKKVKKDDFAYARSHEASKFAYETCKVIAQSCLLINGGAATAVVALLSKEKVDQSLLTWVPLGLGAYALGVVCSAVMLFCVMMMADNWNYAWYWWSYGNGHETGDECETKAGHWHKGVYTFFAAPIICFTLGCGFVAYGLAKSLPTSSGPFPSVIYLPAAR